MMPVATNAEAKVVAVTVWPTTSVVSLCSLDSGLEKVQQHVDDAVAKGAKVICGGRFVPFAVAASVCMHAVPQIVGMVSALGCLFTLVSCAFGSRNLDVGGEGGHFFNPTVLANADPSMICVSEETFGECSWSFCPW